MWGANLRFFFSKYSAFTLILYLKGNINSRGNVSCYYFRILESNRIEEVDQNQHRNFFLKIRYKYSKFWQREIDRIPPKY